MGKGLLVFLITLTLMSAGIDAPAAHAADNDDGSPASAAGEAALSIDAAASVIDVSKLVPLYRVTFMKSRTTDPIRTATVVSVTNQAPQPCDVAVEWFRGFDPTPVCTTTMSLDVGFQTDFCSRAIPDPLTSCNSTCTPNLTFHEGTAVVYGHVYCLFGSPFGGDPGLAVSARVYYTTGTTDSVVTAISDSKIVRFGNGNLGD